MSMSEHLKKRKSLASATTEIMSPVGDMASGATSDRLVRPNSAKLDFSRKAQKTAPQATQGQQAQTKKRVIIQKAAVSRQIQAVKAPRVGQGEKPKAEAVKTVD